ncbi:hypothetical protein ACU8KH_02700 [Lachancea thermotolerans]
MYYRVQSVRKSHNRYSIWPLLNTFNVRWMDESTLTYEPVINDHEIFQVPNI